MLQNKFDQVISVFRIMKTSSSSLDAMLFPSRQQKNAAIARRRRAFQQSATKATPANLAMPVKWKAPYICLIRNIENTMHLFLLSTAMYEK